MKEYNTNSNSKQKTKEKDFEDQGGVYYERSGLTRTWMRSCKVEPQPMTMSYDIKKVQKG